MKKGLIISAIAVTLFFLYYHFETVKFFNRHTLPIIQPKDVNEEMVSEELRGKALGHYIGNFTFLDQNNQEVTQNNVKGRVFVAEYFFTTCKTICPIMNKEMERVQEQFKGNPDVKILSFTVDPDVDDVPTMKAYATERNAVDNQWYFLTGDKKDLYDLARKSFFVLKPAEAQNLGDAGSDFIHTNNFVLVDRDMQIRGYYDGTNHDEVTQLMKDIEFLLKEGEEFESIF